MALLLPGEIWVCISDWLQSPVLCYVCRALWGALRGRYACYHSPRGARLEHIAGRLRGNPNVRDVTFIHAGARC